MKEKKSSTISAAQVHSILKEFNYEMVPADKDREVKKVAKAAARAFPGVKISREGDSVYFRYAGKDDQGPSGEFFVKAGGMLRVDMLKGIEKITGIDFAEQIHSKQSQNNL